MNKKLKLSLLGTLIASSALSITMPIVSCSSSSSDVTLTVTRESNFDTKKIAVEAELDKLITTKTDAERRKEFDALNKVYNANSVGDDKATWDALVDIVTFKDGETKVDWANAVESVSLIPGVWPTGDVTTAKEAPVKMKINLKPDYIVADDAALSIDMNISVIAITTLTVTNASDFDTKKAAVEVELDKLITTSSHVERQKEFEDLSTKVYNANSVGADKTTWDALVNIVTFKDGETLKNWIDVVESVSIVPGTWPIGDQAKEAPVKMKINLKPDYNANAATLSIDMNISVIATTTLTVTDGTNNDQKITIGAVLGRPFDSIDSDAERQKKFEALNTKVYSEGSNLWSLAIDIVTFKDVETPVKWVNAVKSITFVPGTWPTGDVNTVKYAPVKMQINLKPSYIVVDASKLSIDIDMRIPTFG